MKTKNLFILFAIAFLTLAIESCNKAPGEGGTSSIQGKVLTINLNAAGDTVTPPYYAMDQDVYIIYGDEDKTYDDKFATSQDGSYRFTNLVQGTYTIFVYSECQSCGSGMEVKEKTVEITTKNEQIILEDIIIYE
jgi:hypothetical protein